MLAWDPPGYKLVVGSKALDTRRFESMADQGRGMLLAGDYAGARDTLAAALELWRGPALLEFAHLDFAWGFAAKLEERRLIATEDRIDADLRLGRHAAVVGELGELVAAHPLREQLRHHMALALYRSGRQAEALRILDDARRTLRDQLGIDPGRPLVELETAILTHDAGLDLVTAGGGATAGPPKVEPAAAHAVAAVRTAPAVAVPPGGNGDGHGEGEGVRGLEAPGGVMAPGARLVGRGLELRQAIAALGEARTASRIVLVEGEPGIGKTRLLEELAAEARSRGTAVLWGRAFEGGATPAFWPWLPPLRTLVADQAPGDIAPELANLVSAGEGTASGAERSRFQLFDAVHRLIADAAATAPLMIVLDDIQWADLASLELLTFVAGQVVSDPILLACSVRQLEVGRNDAVVEALAALSRAAATRRIFLRGLSHADTAELVALAAGPDVAEDVTAAIQLRAEGNPFFATELARLVVAEHATADLLGAVSPGGDVPSGVRDVVRRRIALLPDETVALLQVAGVMGREVDLDLLAAAADADFDTILDDIEPAVVHRLLEPVPDRPATFRFSHALVREAVVDDVSALRRARIHLKVADALAATLGHLDDTAEIIAEHLWSAAPIGVGQRAAEAIERAAEVAVRRYAFESAEALLERAVQLRRSSTRSTLDTEAELTAISRLLSIQRSVAGYASVAESPHLRRAKELARRIERSDILTRLLWTEWAAYDTMCDFERSDAIAEQLWELTSDSDDPLVRAAGLSAVGISHWHHGRVAEGSARLDEAVEAGARADAPAATLGLDLEVLLLPHPFSRYLHVLTGATDPAAGEAVFSDLAALAPDRYAVSLVMMFSAAGAVATGHPDWAERAARRGIEADPESTFSFWGRGLAGYLAAALIDQGRLDEGLPMIDHAIEQFVAGGGRTGVVVFRAARAAGLAEALRLDAASAAVASAYRELATYGERFAEPLVLEADARFRHARGDDPTAIRDLFVRARDLASSQGSLGIADRITARMSRLLG